MCVCLHVSVPSFCVCLSVYVGVSLTVRLSLYHSVYLYIYMCICLYFYLSAYLPVNQAIYPYSHPFVSLSIYVLSVRVFVCIPVHLSLYLLHTLHYTIIIITFFNVMCIIMYVIRRVVDRKNSEVFAFREWSKLIVGVFLRNFVLFL